MAIDTHETIAVADHSRLIHYSIGRCEFSAYVFSGSTDELERLSLFEHDAWSAARYVLPDSRLDPAEDYARTSGAALPRWPADQIAPTAGVCFVLSDSQNPAIEEIRDRGGREFEHFIVADRLSEMLSLDAALAPFVRSLDNDQPVILMAFGDQGRQIAESLRTAFCVPAERILVSDADADRRRQAEESGLEALKSVDAAPPGCAHIYTPYTRYAQLYAQFDAMRRGGDLVFDNSVELSYFVAAGNIYLEGKAARVLDIRDGRLFLRGGATPARAQIIRDDLRRFQDAIVPHLHGGFSAHLKDDRSYELASRPGDDRLGEDTFASARRAYVGLECATRGVADKTGYFAAAEFCREFWPDAVAAVFPARHWMELGRTEFERRLQQILSGFVVGSPKQTPEEQFALAASARHYTNSIETPIVEIGAALGGGTALLAAATTAKRPLIHSIDPSERSAQTVRFVLGQAGYADRVRQHVATSDDAIADLAHLRGRAGLVLIDGAHDAGTAGRDFENYSPLVRPGGVLAIHDFDRTFPGVMKVVIEKVIVDPRFEFKCLVDRLAFFECRS